MSQLCLHSYHMEPPKTWNVSFVCLLVYLNASHQHQFFISLMFLHLLSVLFCVSSLFCSADLILSYLAFVISASTQMTLTFRVTFPEKKKEKKKS